MIFLILAGAIASAAVPRGMPLFETMLEVRAFVIDLRACISVPTPAEHLHPRKDWPLSAGLCHRLEAEIEAQFAGRILRIGHYFADEMPDLPRVLMRLDFNHADMEEPIPTLNKRAYTRVLNGILTVVLLPHGQRVTGIPLRFVLTRATYGEYDAYRRFNLIDLNGVRVSKGPPGGDPDLVRLLNEDILLDALRGRDAECDRLLF